MPNIISFPPAADPVADPWKPKGGYVTPKELEESLKTYVKSDEVIAVIKKITGYDATKVQTLTNDSGTIKWVDVPSEEE